MLGWSEKGLVAMLDNLGCTKISRKKTPAAINSETKADGKKE